MARARFSVVARLAFERLEEASGFGQAGVDRTGLVVVAEERESRTGSPITGFSHGAGVSVVASESVSNGGKEAVSRFQFALSGDAFVTARADFGCAADALAVRARIVDRTGVSILTGHGHRSPNTSDFRRTSIAGAEISVIASEGVAHALPTKARIVCGAEGSIVTGQVIGEILAADFGVAVVVGAGVVVVADQKCPRRAFSLQTKIRVCAGVSIFAKSAIGHVEEEAFTRNGVTPLEYRARVVVVA